MVGHLRGRVALHLLGCQSILQMATTMTRKGCQCPTVLVSLEALDARRRRTCCLVPDDPNAVAFKSLHLSQIGRQCGLS